MLSNLTVDTAYTYLLYFLFGFSILTFLGSFFYTTPYGRFKKTDEKFEIASLPGWLMMEFPCLVACLITFFTSGGNTDALVPLVFLCIWQAHYTYRSIIFPLRMRDSGKKMPVAAVAFGVFFNSLNGFLNGYAFTHSEHLLNTDWLTGPNFILGVLVMMIGLSININSDNILRNLRKPGETGYKVPRGGLYRWVSVPNYLGEIIEWIGLSIAACTPAALAFAVFSIANLFPRALAHHKWYQEKFDDYPKERKAIIPFII
jgi:3-oxo-5-alpha-steroid 4-dehydrogenase 1